VDFGSPYRQSLNAEQRLRSTPIARGLDRQVGARIEEQGLSGGAPRVPYSGNSGDLVIRQGSPLQIGKSWNAVDVDSRANCVFANEPVAIPQGGIDYKFLLTFTANISTLGVERASVDGRYSGPNDCRHGGGAQGLRVVSGRKCSPPSTRSENSRGGNRVHRAVLDAVRLIPRARIRCSRSG
jgi:hypothetical protein